MITNKEFLSVVFGNEYENVHVTDFVYDPFEIPVTERMFSWAGRAYKDYEFKKASNQYFTISLFNLDSEQKSRRRRLLFKQCNVIVLDDVKEKLSLQECQKLPTPTYILETSPGSEQWGYVLQTPCTDRFQIENLQDGLIKKGLSPTGTDPGMRGVTRYVRLPEGYNTKKKKMVDGQPFKCQITKWDPFNRVTLEELAVVFNIDLKAKRQEERLDGAAQVDNHPMFNYLNVKEIRSPGRYDVTCPWVEYHTGKDDSGSAVFTNSDYSLGFQCHHGHCEEKTGKHLVEWLEECNPGFESELHKWKIKQTVQSITRLKPVTPEVEPETELTTQQVVGEFISQLGSNPPGSEEQRAVAKKCLIFIKDLSALEKNEYEKQLRFAMGWSKTDLKEIVKDLFTEKSVLSQIKDVFNDHVFISENNAFYNIKTRSFSTADGFNNSFYHFDKEIKTIALSANGIKKVDKLDFVPGYEQFFEEEDTSYVNVWRPSNSKLGVEGDVSIWLNHFDQIGWSNHREHVLKWFAYTILHPEKKINHMLLFGGPEGVGKDFLIQPLVRALGRDHKTINGDALLDPDNNYLFCTKHLHINEINIKDRNESAKLAERLKPLATSPPNTLRFNEKFIKKIDIRNIVNCTLAVNSFTPIRLENESRRYYAMWSDISVFGTDSCTTPYWRNYWTKAWDWFENGGDQAVIYYLRNCVDLSNFNPKESPEVTDYLRDIVNSSKSVLQISLESMISRKLGIFASDLLTVEEVCVAIKMSEFLAPDLPNFAEKGVTAPTINALFHTMNGITKLESGLWCIRNPMKWRNATEFEQKYHHSVMVNETKKLGIRVVK